MTTKDRACPTPSCVRNCRQHVCRSDTAAGAHPVAVARVLRELPGDALDVTPARQLRRRRVAHQLFVVAERLTRMGARGGQCTSVNVLRPHQPRKLLMR